MYVGVEAKGKPLVSSSGMLTISSEKGALIAWGSLNILDQLVSKPQGFPLSLPPQFGIVQMHTIGCSNLLWVLTRTQVLMLAR